MSGYCVHATSMTTDTRTHHVATPEFDGVPLVKGTRLDGSPYWRAWAPYPTRLFKAHERASRCEFHDRSGSACCGADGMD